ncbi:hypothetical protein FDP41_006350 [Naegleria fowleri]|uniref:Uncharacterized protein n=1 Tax=Naegleria fowleri TaxID=5763 RepID=A0A6A5BJ83_NAEFO|nr:uncharacterized protein FDP41_006350 [Naegleria fowleri]KAF0974876.1 hypothetical protein FDP41_006350 [Naegleria fowleri]
MTKGNRYLDSALDHEKDKQIRMDHTSSYSHHEENPRHHHLREEPPSHMEQALTSSSSSSETNTSQTQLSLHSSNRKSRKKHSKRYYMVETHDDDECEENNGEEQHDCDDDSDRNDHSEVKPNTEKKNNQFIMMNNIPQEEPLIQVSEERSNQEQLPSLSHEDSTQSSQHTKPPQKASRHHHEDTILDHLDDVLDVFNENVLPTLLHTEHTLRHSHAATTTSTKTTTNGMITKDKSHHLAAEDAPSYSKVGDSTDHEVSFSSSSSENSCCEVTASVSAIHVDLTAPAMTRNETFNNKEEEQVPKVSKSVFFRKRVTNLILFLLGTMCFKFSYETLSGAIGLTILTRLENHPLGATTILSLLTITFGISQSISSTLVEGFLKQVRATRLYSMALLFFSLLILTMIVLEATTGGTLTEAGYWSPWIIFPIYVFIGFNIGVIEVVRKVIPASILGNSESSTLKRLNASIHIIYEVAGTIGAFLSSVFIEKLGSIYALCHIPLFFTLGAVFLFFISSKCDTQEQSENDDSVSENHFDLSPQRERFAILRRVGIAVKNYFKSMFIGAKIVLANRYYIWLIPCFVLPQTLHRLIENIFLPAYAKMILKKGSYSGIMLGGSNFGELLGAGLLFLLAKKVKKPTIWILMDALFLNLMWIFPFLTFDETTNNNLIFAICIVPAMVLTSGSYAAGDCTQIAYIQSTLSDEVNEQTGVNELAAVMSFLYSCYIIITTFVVFGLSQGIDRFNAEKRPEFGFMTICIVLTVLSVVIVALYLLFTKIKPTHEEEEEERKKEEISELSSVEKNSFTENNGNLTIPRNFNM